MCRPALLSFRREPPGDQRNLAPRRRQQAIFVGDDPLYCHSAGSVSDQRNLAPRRHEMPHFPTTPARIRRARAHHAAATMRLSSCAKNASPSRADFSPFTRYHGNRRSILHTIAVGCADATSSTWRASPVWSSPDPRHSEQPLQTTHRVVSPRIRFALRKGESMMLLVHTRAAATGIARIEAHA